MALIFTPPTAALVPATVRPRHPGHALFRHYQPWQAGINVFLLVDGTVTTAQPYGDETVARTFHGGHVHEVNNTEAALLSAAGYNIVETT